MLLSATFMGFGGLFVKFMPVSVYGVLEYRGLFGFAWSTIILLLMRKLGMIPKILKYWRQLIVICLTTILTVLFYFSAIDISGLATAAFLLYNGNLICVLFLTVFMKEKSPRVIYLSYLIAIIGVFLIMQPWKAINLSWGLLMGLLSALMLGSLTFTRKLLYKQISQEPVEEQLDKNDVSALLTWYSTLGLAIALSFVFFIEGPSMMLPSSVIGGILLGLFPTALAFTLYNIALQKDKGGNIIIIAYAEPFVASIIELIVFHVFSIFVLIGGCLIIVGNAIALFSKNN
ncbi:MAG: DMT family transporter [Candidatus Hodarchaeota archaeon]